MKRAILLTVLVAIATVFLLSLEPARLRPGRQRRGL